VLGKKSLIELFRTREVKPFYVLMCDIEVDCGDCATPGARQKNELATGPRETVGVVGSEAEPVEDCLVEGTPIVGGKTREASLDGGLTLQPRLIEIAGGKPGFEIRTAKKAGIKPEVLDPGADAGRFASARGKEGGQRLGAMATIRWRVEAELAQDNGRKRVRRCR
jgi:hypothetical protein